MSETITTNYEVDTTPTSSEVLTAFSERRDELNARVDELAKKPGFKMNGTELIDHRRDTKAAQSELNAFNEEYHALGGAELDAAEKAVSELGVTSSAEDHVAAKSRRTAARNAFYENFLASEEIAKIEAEEQQQADIIASMPAATTDPANISSNEALKTQTKKVSTFEPLKPIDIDNYRSKEQNDEDQDDVKKVATPASASSIEPIDVEQYEDDDDEAVEAAASKADEEQKLRLGQRIHNAYQRATALASGLKMKLADRLNPEETDEDREKQKLRINAKTLGAFAVGAAGVIGVTLLAKYGYTGGGGSHNAMNHANDYVSSGHGGGAAAASVEHINTNQDAVVQDFEKWLDSAANHTGYTTQKGDTIWGLSKQYLENHGVSDPSNAQIAEVTNKVTPIMQQKGFAAPSNAWLTAGQHIKF